MTDVITEEWAVIQAFPNYHVSNLGRVYNQLHDHYLSPTPNNYGTMRVYLTRDYDRTKHTLSLSRLVADYFVDPPDILSDTPILLDGDQTNCAAHNIVWRPRWFAWKYRRQMHQDHPRPYHNLVVINKGTRDEYANIIQAGKAEGLLFDDIWISCNTGRRIYPNSSIFEVVDIYKDIR